MECLFNADKPHLATWLWIYNEDRGYSMSTMSPEKPEAVPLYYAAMLGFRDLAERLIAEHPEHVSARGGREGIPMHIAAFTGHANILVLLVEHGADVDGRDGSQTPVHQTLCYGRLEAGQCLLDHGADINPQSDSGWTSLIFVVYLGHVEFARMLLKRGARINATDAFHSRTPLHWAVAQRRIQAVRLLLEYDADVNARDKSGKTPPQYGSASGEHEIVGLLSEYGAT